MPLTPQQQTILSAIDTSVAVSAGAGCGKTFVLTERFMVFLRARVGHSDPLAGIVAITFTNKAAREMRQRVRQACVRELQQAPVGEVAYWTDVIRGLDGARISTIHSFCAALLRRFAAEAGLNPAFAVPDSSLGGAFIDRAVRDAYCELLEVGHLDAREFVLKFGLERAFTTIGELVPDLRGSSDPAQFDELSAADLWQRWKAHWEEYCVPEICRDFLESPKVAVVARLLTEHEPSHPKMSERRQNLLKFLENGPPERPGEWFASIVKNAVIQGGGNAGAWLDPAIYEEIKDAFTALRNEAKKIASQLKSTEMPDPEAASIALQAHRIARDVLARVEGRKQRESLVEFDDLLWRTRDLLRDRPQTVGRAAGTGLELLMVDEFQDTDPIQAEIVRLLCGEFLTSGRLFLVGDAKQSIYRFRGADPRVFGELRRMLPERGHLPLSTNFRSQPAILNFVNYTFETEIPDYEPLEASCPQQSPEPAIEFLFSSIGQEDTSGGEDEDTRAAARRGQEARWIAARLAELLEDETPRVRDAGTGQLRRAAPGDIAILFRGLPNVHVYEQALSERDLPYYLVKSRAFFAQQEVRDIAHLCRWLDDPSDELSLAGVLRSPLFGLTDDTLFALKPEKQRHFEDGLAKPPALPETQAEQVDRTWRILQELRAAKDVLPLVELLTLAIERTGYDAALLAEHLGSRKLANLRKLLDIARNFSETGPVTLADFAGRLQESVKEETAEEVAATHPEVGDVLRLMTIHQAKGLEFPIVVLAEMEWRLKNDKSAAEYLGDLGPIFGIPLELRPEFVASFEEDEKEKSKKKTSDIEKNHLGVLIRKTWERAANDAETTRLFYVAATRPRDHLILSGCFKPSGSHESPWMKLLARRFDLSTGLPPVDPILGAVSGTSAAPANLPAVRVHHNAPGLGAVAVERRHASVSLRNFRERVAQATPEALPDVMARIFVDPAAWREFTTTDLTAIDCSTPEEIATGFNDEDNAETVVAPGADSPTFRREDVKTVGTLVHHVLEQFDFTAPVRTEAAIEALVSQSQLTLFGRMDKELSRAAAGKIRMLLESSLLGELAGAQRLYRELPFRLLWPEEGEDRVEIVGVIDGLFQDAAGDWHIYDYKITESAQKDDAAMVARYELQILIYAMAVERAFGVRPKSAELIRLQRKATRIPVRWDEGQMDGVNRRIERAIAALRASLADSQVNADSTRLVGS